MGVHCQCRYTLIEKTSFHLVHCCIGFKKRAHVNAQASTFKVKFFEQGRKFKVKFSCTKPMHHPSPTCKFLGSSSPMHVGMLSKTPSSYPRLHWVWWKEHVCKPPYVLDVGTQPNILCGFIFYSHPCAILLWPPSTKGECQCTHEPYFCHTHNYLEYPKWVHVGSPPWIWNASTFFVWVLFATFHLPCKISYPSSTKCTRQWHLETLFSTF